VRPYFAVAGLILAATVLFSQESNSKPSKKKMPPTPATLSTPTGNTIGARGIVVGVPKVFDDRALTLMLETLNNSLSNVNVVNQQTLAQAIGTIQGSRTHEVASAFTLQGTPTPQIQTENSQSSAPNATGQMAPASASLKTTTTSASVTPGIPWSSDMATLPTAYTNLNYNMSSSDLLSEQVDLMYQIFNIRMLLDRSLSDRLLWETQTDKPTHRPTDRPTTRLQAVIGLNVTVDPPGDAENAAAVVEVTLFKPCLTEKGMQPCRATDQGTNHLSLVAVMPQEHTYNAAALNSKATAFGGAAVAKMINVGFTDRRRGQTYYLFRDNDTVSFERQTDPDSTAITFGWVFRPVLGRKSVAPGMRQMFAVVSLPDDDAPCDDPDNCPPVKIQANVHAYWKKYDPKNLTTSSISEIGFGAKLIRVLSLGMAAPYPPAGDSDIRKGYPINVPKTSNSLTGLQPTVAEIQWRPAGAKQAVISVKGTNLFDGTAVALGDKVYAGNGDGLRFVNNQNLDITTDLTALLADGAVLGRYAPARPLSIDRAKTIDPAKTGLMIQSEGSLPLAGYFQLTLVPSFDPAAADQPRQCLKNEDLEADKLGMPVVSVNGVPVQGPYEFPADAAGCLQIVAYVPQPPPGSAAMGNGPAAAPVSPTSLTSANTPSATPVSASSSAAGSTTSGTAVSAGLGVASVRFPFRGKALKASVRVYDPRNVFTAQSLATETANSQQYLIQKIDGPFFPPGAKPKFVWRILVNGKTLDLETCADPITPASVRLKDAPPNAYPKDFFCALSPNDMYARLNLTTTPAPVAGSGPDPQSAATGAAAKPGTITALLQSGVKNPNQLESWQWTYTVTLTPGTHTLTPSGSPSDSSAAKLDDLSINTKHVNQYDQVWVTFTGSGLDQVASVTLGTTVLQTNTAKQGKSIAVFVPQAFTSQSAGSTNLDLTFLDKSSKQIGIARVVIDAKIGNPKK
jgi:hypothetical protein